MDEPYKIFFWRLDPGGEGNVALQGEEINRIRSVAQDCGLFRVKDAEESKFTSILYKLIRDEYDIIHLSGHGTDRTLSIPNYSNVDKGAEGATRIARRQTE